MKISRHVLRSLCLIGLWLGLGLQAYAQTDTVTYVYTDPQGTPLVEADASGNVIARYDYTPYGNSVASLGNPPNGPGYTGHVNDPETGLVYMQARYYQPTGRFLSPDPAGPNPSNLFSFNRYAYVNNNPIINTDPDGRCVDADWGCGAIARSFAKHPEATKALGPYAAGATAVMVGVSLGYGALAAVPEGSIVLTRIGLSTAFCASVPLFCNAEWINKFNPQYEPDAPAETTVLENRKLLDEIEEFLETETADRNNATQQLPAPPPPQPAVAPPDPTLPNPELPPIPPVDPPPSPHPTPSPQPTSPTPQSS